MEPTTDVRAGGSALTDNAWGRIVGVLVSPIRTFESIERRPTWVAPLVVGLAVGLGAALVTAPKIDHESNIRTQLERQGREVDEEEIDRAVGIAKVATVPCSVLLPPVLYVAAALILLVVFNLLGAEVGFHHSFSVMLYGMTPFLLVGLLSIPVAMAQSEIDPVAVQTGGFLASHLGVLAPDDASVVLRALLGSVDLFSIWAIALLVVGYGIVTGLSRTKVAAAVIGLWLVGVALKVGSIALGSLGGG